MCKLVLNVGDAVRNIHPYSNCKGQIGVVTSVGGNQYVVKYEKNQYTTSYGKWTAHHYLEKLVQECPCQQHILKLDLSKLEERILAGYTAGDFIVVGAVHDEVKLAPKRRVLKKVRRNVITGKTQDDFVRDMGHARGVEQFNTRALGKSTGQALACIGQAMMHPGLEIRISQVDHAKANPLCSTSWTTLDKHFRALVQSLIGNMKGFTITNTHIVFNPIVTEETYVEL